MFFVDLMFYTVRVMFNAYWPTLSYVSICNDWSDHVGVRDIFVDVGNVFLIS